MIAEFWGVNGQSSTPNAVATQGAFTDYRRTAMMTTEFWRADGQRSTPRPAPCPGPGPEV